MSVYLLPQQVLLGFCGRGYSFSAYANSPKSDIYYMLSDFSFMKILRTY